MKGRTHNALLAALFTYGQFLIALLAAFFVTPLILSTVGARRYGFWLSSGEIIGYLLLLDFGVFAIMPWLIARADGQKNTVDLKRHLVQGLAVAIFISVILLLMSFVLWGKLPGLLHLGAGDWHSLAGPLCLLVILLAVNLPINIFGSLLNGLQDVSFTGALGLLKAVIGPVLTVGLLLSGHQLYALAIGTAAFAPVGGFLSFLRARRLAPDLLRDWPRPTFVGAAGLFRESIGAWLGGAGVQMMERSSALVLTYMKSPAVVPTLVCTSRIGQVLTQMAWVMPDSALVGLAQLSGEKNIARQREVVFSILRLNVVLAAGAACLVLAINPAFVRIWVGEKYFGGMMLNLLLGAEVISGSVVHALASVVAVQGNRLSIGLATLLQGVIYLALAIILTRQYLLEGLLAADLLAPLFSMVPTSLWLLRSTLEIDVWRLMSVLSSILVLRAGPCLLVAWVYGSWRQPHAGLLELSGASVLLGFVYLHVMGSQLATFPLPTKAKVFLQRLRVG